ncbi:hypothetical protein [Reyranella sp.]|uniref:hypothetical protein n=1 Tax=Reyranella sp. TaxID=1929291 RepID=UPI00403699F1
MSVREARQMAREAVIERLAAYRREPSEARLQFLKVAVERWLQVVEAADLVEAGPSSGKLR